MAGVVFLRTNLFEVKLEGITFKSQDFASLCATDFLFPKTAFWPESHPPVIGIDVIRHPRDASVLLLLLSFGVGCVVLRFPAGEPLPIAIHAFLSDKRIRFVAFGMKRKEDLFPFQELGLNREAVDVGYIAANVLNDSVYKDFELGELAERILGIDRMVGLTDVSSFRRHEEIKAAICQLFLTTVIAMGLLNKSSSSSSSSSSPSKKTSFLKTLNSLHLLAEGWFKLPLTTRNRARRRRRRNRDEDEEEEEESSSNNNNNIIIQTPQLRDDDYESQLFASNFRDGDPFVDWFIRSTEKTEYPPAAVLDDDDDNKRGLPGKPIKGILKAPSKAESSSHLHRSLTFPSRPFAGRCSSLKKANSKGCNVHFKFQ